MQTQCYPTAQRVVLDANSDDRFDKKSKQIIKLSHVCNFYDHFEFTALTVCEQIAAGASKFLNSIPTLLRALICCMGLFDCVSLMLRFQPNRSYICF